VTAEAGPCRLGRIDTPRVDEAEKPFDRLLVSEALKQLQPSHREVIRKAYYLGWTTCQIAADLNVTEPVAMSRLHYAVRTLRVGLNPPR
jgi:RNA polymerase sigma-70 factor (ECF subfamily)